MLVLEQQNLLRRVKFHLQYVVFNLNWIVN